MSQFPQLDFSLGETIDLLRQSVRDFVANEITPNADAIDGDGQMPRELWRKMGALGLLGITAEERFGGAAMGYLEHTVAMEEISRGSASVGLSFGAHANLCVNQISLNGSEMQKQRFLPGLIEGSAVGALAISEANAGSDIVSMRLAATRTQDHYLLNGTKMWITNGPDADVVVVYAKTSPERKQHGITSFIVEASSEGFSTGPKLDKLGMRGSPTSELIFDNCVVGVDNVLGGVDRGIEVLMSGLDFERLVLAAGPLGIMAACLELVLPYVHERRQFGRPIGQFELMQGKLADMYAALSACRSYVYAVARAADAGRSIRKDAAALILFVSEQATRMALEAIQCLGANGYLNDFAAGRLLRDAKLYEIGAGTNEIRRMLVGRELFKETSD